MTPENKLRINRAIAEKLGWTVDKDCAGYGEFGFRSWKDHKDTGSYGEFPERMIGYGPLPDYFESEDASAILLESMPHVELKRSLHRLGWWCAMWNDDGTVKCFADHADRKTAIVHAKCVELGIPWGEA